MAKLGDVLKPGQQRKNLSPDAPQAGKISRETEKTVIESVYRYPRQGGRGGGGSGSSRASASAQAAFKAQQAALAQAAALRLAQQQAQERSLAKVAEANAKIELNRINLMRSKIISNRGSITEKKSRDVATGNILKTTEYRQNGNLVRRIQDTNTGDIKFSTYAPGRGGGSVRRTGGVTLKGKAKTAPTAYDIASRVSITKSSDPNKVIVTFPNGQKGYISAKGKSVVGAKLAGHKYTFENGVIIAVDGRTTGAREEFAPVLTVEAVSQPKGKIARIIKKLNDMRKVKSTSSIRNKQTKLKNELSLLGLTTATTIISGTVAFVALPSTVLNLIKNPSQITRIPGAIARAGKNFGQMMRVSPTEVLGVVAGEVILFKGAGATLKVVGKVSNNVKNVVRPALNKADKTKFTVNGNTIRLAGGTASTAESLAKQAGRAGKKAVGVTALADDIFKLMKRKNIVRKPIPSENLLTARTKKLLNKFDMGKASKSEMMKLDRLIRIETKGAGALLERGTFADPAGRIRASRLGLEQQKDASFLDIISGDFTFRANKPQVLVFDNIVIEAFPASLKKIARKFKAGKTLTQSEADALLKFQLKKSGKFKPIGFLSKESEIVLAPGEIIKKVKKVGVVLVNGKRVPVVKVKVLKTSGELKTLLNKFNKNKITSAELKKLAKLLEKNTGFKNKVSRSGNARPVARFPGVIGARRGVVRRGVKRKGVRITRRPPKRPPKRPGRITRVPKRHGKRPPKRPGRTPPRTARPPKRPPRRPPKRPPRKPPIIPPRLKKKFTKRTIPKKVEVYYIKVKKKGKIINLTPRPLQLSEAKDLLVWSVDHNLVRSGWFHPLGKSKRVIGLPAKIKGYYSRNARKVRPFKIKDKKHKQILNGFIEKRKFIQDTPREKAQLQTAAKRARLARRKQPKRIKPVNRRNINAKNNQRKPLTLAQLKAKKRAMLLQNKKAKRMIIARANVIRRQRSRPKRKLSPQQRKRMLLNMAKARRAKHKK